MKTGLSTLAIALLVTSTSYTANADDIDAEAVIKYRQDAMTAIKGHNSAVRSILGGKVPFTGQLDTHLGSLEALLGDVGKLFPEGSDFGETNAKEAIWDNPDKFNKEVKKAQTAFADFMKVYKKGDMKASAGAYKKFGKNSCGSCHKSYKVKDD